MVVGHGLDEDADRVRPPEEDESQVIDLTAPGHDGRSGDLRDAAATERDRAAHQRDQAAEARDKAAERREQDAQPAAWVREASQDRQAGAQDRQCAGLDRHAALADRKAAATQRACAAVDELTGAYLRRAGFAELEREVERARRTNQPLVLAFVDVDRLKAINDSRGHAAGDQMLLEVANAFRAKLRAYDLIIRYGGDEFVCAISGLNIADAARRFALVNETLAEGHERGSVTVGLAELQPEDSTRDLLARADAALYRERQ